MEFNLFLSKNLEEISKSSLEKPQYEIQIIVMIDVYFSVPANLYQFGNSSKDRFFEPGQIFSSLAFQGFSEEGKGIFRLPGVTQ